jgi:adenosylcobinamide-phosphate synthase
MTETVTLTLAYITDILIGDPRWAPHPVRAIGRTIEIAEQYLRKWFSRYADTGQKAAGIIMAISIPFLTYVIFYLLTTLLQRSGVQVAATIVIVYLIASSLATRELVKSAGSVIEALLHDDIQEARKRLSMIVGRDTADLDRKGVLKAVIETLAENSSDGVVAPMFYFAIGGLPLAMTYKAVNTLDSMVGYKNDRYRHFGWASARLDDILNFIPARITGILIVAATFLSELFTRPNSSGSANAWKIMRRDGRKHASPNSGVPEAAMAGALGIRLGGPSSYGGVRIEKPYIGEAGPGAIGAMQDDLYLSASVRAILLVRLTSVLGLILALSALHLRSAL